MCEPTTSSWPQRLRHTTPGWVKYGAVFHIRLRTASTWRSTLADADIARDIIAAAQNYHQRNRWFVSLLMVMPDHIHALLSFPAGEDMARCIGQWKAYTTRTFGIRWQTNFFDHRIRDDGAFREAWAYILRNPVAKGLCQSPSDWPHTWRP